MQFLTPGQRIKKYRKLLKLTQNEFECESMTRSYFGMIEVGKRNLKLDIAVVILKRFRERAQELNIELDIDEAHLMMSPKDEAREYCIEKLYKFSSKEDVDHIVTICREWELTEVEIEAVKTLADIEYREKRFLEAFIKYSDALDLCKSIGKTDIQSYLYNRLGACKYNDLDYEEAILYFSKAQQYSKIYEDLDVERKSIFNIATTYIRLNKIDETIVYLDLYLCKLDLSDKYTDQLIQANMLKANCMDEQGNTKEAINILNDILNMNLSINKLLEGSIYNNLGSFYLNVGDYDNSLICFNRSEELRRKYDEEHLFRTIIDKAVLYFKMNLYTEAIMIIDMGVQLAEKYNDSFYLLKGYYLLIDIYENQGKKQNMEELYFKIITIVQKKYNYKEQIKVYLKIAEYYTKINKLEDVIKYLRLSQEVVENCCN